MTNLEAVKKSMLRTAEEKEQEAIEVEELVGVISENGRRWKAKLLREEAVHLREQASIPGVRRLGGKP